MKCPKKHVKDDLACDSIAYFFFEMPQFLCSKLLKCPNRKRTENDFFFIFGSSHDKVIFHMLFGAFHITSRIRSKIQTKNGTALFSNAFKYGFIPGSLQNETLRMWYYVNAWWYREPLSGRKSEKHKMNYF